MAITTPPTYIPTEDRHLSDLSGERRSEFDADAVPDHDRLAGQLSLLAYELQIDAQHTLRATGHWSDVIVCTSKLGAQAICGMRDGEAWIAFRGTKQLADFAVDALAVPVRSHHLGFLLAWRSLAKEITSWLQEARPEAIHLTGHSLGGSMALVAALDLARKDAPSTPYPVGSVVTFAAPRAFRLKATSAYASATSRVRDKNRSLCHVTTCYGHKRDLIRRLADAVGYSHVGSAVELPDTKRYVASFVASVFPWLFLIVFTRSAHLVFGGVFTAVDEVVSEFIVLGFACMVFVTALQLMAQSVGSHAATQYATTLGATPLPVRRSPDRRLAAVKSWIGAIVGLGVVVTASYALGVFGWIGGAGSVFTPAFIAQISIGLAFGLVGHRMGPWISLGGQRVVEAVKKRNLFDRVAS